MNLDKERNQMTVESDRISDFIQQLKDLPDVRVQSLVSTSGLTPL